VYVFGTSTEDVRLNVQTGAIDVVVDVELDDVVVEDDVVVVDVVEPGTVVVVVVPWVGGVGESLPHAVSQIAQSTAGTALVNV